MKIIILILFPILLFSQITFEKKFKGKGHSEGYAICETSDGGFVISGYTRPVATSMDSMDVFLVKINELGDSVWTKMYGGSKTERGYAICATYDGGCVVAGITQSWGLNQDCYVLKIKANGDTTWTVHYGRQWSDGAYSVIESFTGDYIIAGNTEFGENGGAQDIYLVKVKRNGTIDWERQLGTFGIDWGYSVIQTADSGFAIAGYESIVGSSAYNNFYFIKTDSSGIFDWSKTYGGDDLDRASSIKQTKDGGYIIVGYTSSFGAQNNDIYLVKTKENGDTLWTRVIGDENKNEGFDVLELVDEGYVIVGTSNSDVYLAKTDLNGDILWTRSYGFDSNGHEEGRSIKQTDDGGFIIAGYYNDYPGYLLYEIKTDSEGMVTEIFNSNQKIVKEFTLEQNYPNPFNPSTTIRYTVWAQNLVPLPHVDLSIYNILGQKVATLVNKKQIAGSYQVEWDASGFASGVYLYKLETENGYSQVKKLVLLK